MMLQLNPAFTNNLIESVRAKMPALRMDLDASFQATTDDVYHNI
jgi:hypothetical protein